MARRVPNVLTAEEQARMLAQPNRKCPTGERNWLLMKIMLDTGLRLSEAINLTWSAVDLNVGRIFVKNGKGEKDAVLWTTDENVKALQVWRVRQNDVVTGRGNPAPAAVFSTLDGKSLGPRYVERMVKRYALKAGIEKDVYPHLLRHCFATDFLRETKNIRLVQRAGRWARLQTVEVYTHIVDDEAENAMRTFRRPAAAAGPGA